MKQRLNYAEFAPKTIQKLVDFSMATKDSSLSPLMIDLIQTRASQINGCTFCVDMHVKEAKIHGERELRLYHLAVWRESYLFTEKERAALEFTEILTKVTPEGVSDEQYAKLKEHFSDKEIVDLTFSIGVINVWNRMNAVFRSKPGQLDRMYGLDKAGLE